MLSSAGRLLLSWVSTLKFKIVAIAIVTGVASAVISTYFVLARTQQETQRMLLLHVAEERERSATLLASKVTLFETTLSAVANQVTPQLLDDPAALTQYLRSQASLRALFDNLFIAAADGSMRTRVRKNTEQQDLIHIGDREYFLRTMHTGLPVISRPLIGRSTKTPVVIVTAPIRGKDGKPIGLVAGVVELRRSILLDNTSHDDSVDLSREMVMDVTGMVVAHPNPMRLLGRAEEDPGVAAAYQQWVRNGRTVHTEGVAQIVDGYLVSMAGIPEAEWMVIRVMPESVALQPLIAAQATAWRAAAAVGAGAALLAGLLAWSFTRRISVLRRRAEALRDDGEPAVQDWPHGNDEVGQLSRAFLKVVHERHLKQEETAGLLRQLQAVLDNAEVGIGFTRSGRFELVSEQFSRIFGWPKDMVRGQDTRMIYASDEAYAALAERARPALQQLGAFDGELELVRRSGERFWAHLRGRAVVPGDPSQGTIWIVEDVTHAREQRERLAWVASHDSLTGLANRAEFESLLEQATARASQHPFCALFIDLDRFKQVNDSAGHAAGDALLRELSQELISQVRQTDTVARLGGDEFAVLLPHCPVAQAIAIAEKIRHAVERYELRWNGERLSVGASIGLVPVDGRFGKHADVLVAADRACYAAKRSGRNRVSVHGREEPPANQSAPQAA
jgi:diguanylate cyclase (GGDEF)-like protein/PAS domain S-box-containing protein